ILFGILYIINLGIVLLIYVKTDVLPWWALILLCLSKRVHSIFVLRLFNDCFAMTLLHAAMGSILFGWWHLGLIIFSAAVSIKMNVLLYAPSLFILMLKAMSISGVISALAGAALVQEALPACVLILFYILSKGFCRLSVNFKFVPEPIFVSKEFAVSLLIAHLVLLVVFAHYKWCKHEGGLFKFLRSRISFCSITSGSAWPKTLKKERKYRDNDVCWKLHRHYMCPFITLSILLVRVDFRRNRAVLERISIKLVFVSPTPLSSLTYTVWFMVFYGRESLRER
ncbi:hypothetical protein Golax_004752, partial [Gossypium laxum]|nr:hypothetical protein [Gossypium laxum]